MGYRSDVTYAFYTMKPDVVSFAAIKLWFDENFAKNVSYYDKIETGDDWIMVHWEGVKWYDDFDEVEAARGGAALFAETFDADNTDNVGWEMVEVGEDLNDIKHDGSMHCNYRLYVRRDITFD
jgi:hypothetical protein